jgi:putative aminopeptidase FrvX
MKTLIKKLVETNSPSGYESAIRAVIKKEIVNLADNIRTDALGNLIARKGKRNPGGLRIMVAAHMDEIGVMASHIDDKGFIRFVPIGGFVSHVCYGERVQFLNGTRGIISGEKSKDFEKVSTIDELFIDTGVDNKKESSINIGDIAVFERPYIEFKNRIVAKALDDRIGVAVLIETMRKLNETPHEIHFVFTTQEEVGERGAMGAAFGIDPDLALVIDLTGSGDTPRGTRKEVSLGQGPAITIRDHMMIVDPKIIRWMTATADESHIPYQLEILEGGCTDGHAIQITRAGIPTGMLSIPARYIHSPSEMVDYGDVEGSVSLLLDLISNPIQLDIQ